ncbi:HAD family hydrolase [Agarilytica rhodophyticola]|uniref:HAD family hydrolase n=1 Tax=Agarilytica rhodophyticola TaxID=1737490 RepID=UPI000B345684|nr:HAD family phosphatase [Agarilytica rhodophyticola]
MSLQGVIFDHDGTLVDSERFHYDIWQQLMQSHHIHFSEQDYIAHCSGVPSIENARFIVNKYDIDLEPNALCQAKEALCAKYFDQHETILLPYVQQTIEQCHKLGLRLAVATGAPRTTVQKSISKRDFFPLFSCVATSDDVVHNKPAADVYLLALSSLMLKADECIAIEDSPTGIAAAKAAKLRCIAVQNHYSRQQDLSAADYIVDDLSQAYSIIESLIG